MTKCFEVGLAVSVLLLAMPAVAQETQEEPPALGLSPGVPQTGALPGGTAPAYGQRSTDAQDWRFDFHGMFTAPLRAGINTRENVQAGQSETVLHAPPVVPDDLETFSHTGVVPTPYAQMNFSYGNKVVTGNVFVLAKVASVAAGFFDPSAQLGINDVFLNFNLPDIGKNMRFEVNVGAFTNRYGIMGEYDEGRYGTPVMARTNGAGENIVGRFVLGDFVIAVEQGIQGQTDKAPADLVPDGWNGFADPNAGVSWVNHAHVGLGYKGLALLGGHYMTAWSQDDRATPTNQADGRIDLLGADLRLTLGRFGHFYLGASRVDADRARSVGRIVEILNTRGGLGLMQNYLGMDSGGTGTLFTLAAQYDLSLARLLRYPEPFYGDGPDIFISLFGMRTEVTSREARRHGVAKLKFGAEGTYSLLSWLAAGIRYDHVDPNPYNEDFLAPGVESNYYSFAVVSPRVILRSGWQARDQVVIQYSRWLNGQYTTVRTGYPPREDVSVIPDEHVVSLSASMWW